MYSLTMTTVTLLQSLRVAPSGLLISENPDLVGTGWLTAMTFEHSGEETLEKLFHASCLPEPTDDRINRVTQ